jgi:diadenosine tetraphosphate (Ap4A) HIT family hydrolase
MTDCVICRGVDGDPEMLREEVWSDDLWRLTTALIGEVAGFSNLEPRRHVRYVHELDGLEAETFGSVLARTTAAIKQATDAEQIYVYVFGDSIPHLHLHLAPHREGDPLNASMIKGELSEQELPGGGVLVTSADYPPLPEAELRTAADRVRSALRR